MWFLKANPLLKAQRAPAHSTTRSGAGRAYLGRLHGMEGEGGIHTWACSVALLGLNGEVFQTQRGMRKKKPASDMDTKSVLDTPRLPQEEGFYNRREKNEV